MKYIIKWKKVFFVTMLLNVGIGIIIGGLILNVVHGGDTVLHDRSISMFFSAMLIMDLALLFWIILNKSPMFTEYLGDDHKITMSEIKNNFILGELAIINNTMSMGNRLIAAILLSLAGKGFIRINFNSKSNVLKSIIASESQRCFFDVLNADFKNSNLTEEESIIMERLVKRIDDNNKIEGRKLQSKLMASFARIRSIAKKRLKQKEYFSKWNGLFKALYLIAIPVSVWILTIIEGEFNLTLIPTLLIIIEFSILMVLLKHKTTTGLQVQTTMVQFRKKDEYEFLNSMDMQKFNELLPVCMMMGETMLEKLANSCDNCYQPVEWFSVDNEYIGDVRVFLEAIYSFAQICVAEFIGNSADIG